jgi:hypothetical protein
MDRPVYRELTNKSLQMLEPGYRDRSAVEDTLGHVGDWSLGAEVTRWNVLKKKVKRIHDQIWEREDQLFALSVDQRCATRGLKRPGLLVGCRKRCTGTGGCTHSRHGQSNVVVQPEKGMMSRFGSEDP